MIQRSAADLAGGASDGVDCTGVFGAAGRLDVGRRITPVAAIDYHAAAEGSRRTVVAIDEERALVGMAVAAQHQIDAPRFEDREEVLPHLREDGIGVGVV